MKKMKKSISPLRYPGGKAKVFNKIVNLFIENNIEKPIYIEPFAGGAGLAILLLKNKIVNKLVLNDIDKGIYAFWKSVLNYTDDFCKMIENVTLSIEEREKQKQIYLQKKDCALKKKQEILNLGLATFYLNRVNRSGILKAGVIGGKEQKGNYKMDCRFNKKDLIFKIKQIADMKEQIKFYNMDVLKFKKEVIDKIKTQKFIFFDPPYYEKGSELYINFYTHNDHIKLYEEIKEIEQHWIVTYDNCETIKKIYSLFYSKEFDIRYSLQNKVKAKEIVIFSNSIKNTNSF